MSPDGGLFLASWSDIKTPNQQKLYRADGQVVRTVDSNPSHELKQLRFGPRERLQIPTPDGFLLEAELILPPDLDTGKKYPVWFMTYGGPHAPTVSDSWLGGRMQDHILAKDGFVVFRMDPRSASGKGANSTWKAYKHLGVQELEDIKTAINWLKQKPYVDGKRIGMAGHSYGGYITAYALTHSDLFAAGIAGAPVTDWRDYDSIYTERYMGLPQDNPDGYNVSSVVRAADRLHGKLLIIHGAIDDNVSLRNTLRFVEALQDAGKDFQLMIYPSSRHGIMSQHYTQLQHDFIRRTLGGTKPEPPTAGRDLAGESSEGRPARRARRGERGAIPAPSASEGSEPRRASRGNRRELKRPVALGRFTLRRVEGGMSRCVESLDPQVLEHAPDRGKAGDEGSIADPVAVRAAVTYGDRAQSRGAGRRQPRGRVLQRGGRSRRKPQALERAHRARDRTWQRQHRPWR